jgi:hypothetical protein
MRGDIAVLRVPATMILLDHRGAIGGLTFLDHGCPLTISVTVVMAALTNRYTSNTRTEADTHADFFRERGYCQGSYYTSAVGASLRSPRAGP